jgi:hypothetical protein
MDKATSDFPVSDLAAILYAVNSTLNQTSSSEVEPQVANDYFRQRNLPATIGAALLVYIFYRLVRYFTSELPPFGSGLKRLPGPM